MRKLLKKITSTIILIILSPLGIIWDTLMVLVITGAAYFSWLYDKDVQDETYLDLLIDGYKWFFTDSKDTHELFQVLYRNLFK